MLRHTLCDIVFRPARDRQSYINLLYWFTALLLEGVYLLFFLNAFFLSIPIWISILITLFAIPVLLYMVNVERKMIRVWLNLDISVLAPTEGKQASLWKRFHLFIDSGVIWKNLTYMFVKVIIGIWIAGFIAFIFFSSLALFFGSLSYAIIIGMNLLFHMNSFPASTLESLSLSFFFINIYPFAGVSLLPISLALVRLGCTALLGPIFFLGAIYLSNSFVIIWKRFALFTLNASKKDLQLIEARQIAEQERAKAVLADQKRRELITNLSHELRTPVASIQGYAESLLLAYEDTGTALPSPDVLRHYLSIVYRESLQLGTLVDDLLALARAETDEIRLTREEVIAQEVIAEVYQTLMPLARRERQIVLIQQVDSNLPAVLADQQRLTQVLLNLVRNAITNTPDGGIVSIALQKADDSYLALLVADTGIGISVEDQEHIFERFYRADASRSRRSGGVGLGLAIVHDFVCAMGGSISVESTIGEGSTFRVLLPIIQAKKCHQDIYKSAYDCSVC